MRFKKENEMEELEKEKRVTLKGFALWEVKGETYKLKLPVSGIKELEKRYKANLLEFMDGAETLPPLGVMLDVTHVALLTFHHGLKVKDVEDLFEAYLEEGGSQISFYTEVYLDIFAESGFFSKALAQEIKETLEKTKAEL